MFGAKVILDIHDIVPEFYASKFGKSEGGNIWLDAARTSPYKFYQFWLNATDDEAARFAKIFTHWNEEECAALIDDHAKDPGRRKLQKEVAGFITTLVHGTAEKDAAVRASGILFSNSTEGLAELNEQQLLDVFEGVPQAELPKADLASGIAVVDLLTERTGFLPSKGEAKRALKEGSVSVNRTKVPEDKVVSVDSLLNGKFLLLQRGKKNYFLVKVT